jgi:hypothetical protein
VVMEGVTNPETLEALACREGLSVVADLLVQNFRVASDCRNAVQNGMGSYGHIVSEIRQELLLFRGVDFVFEKRTCDSRRGCLNAMVTRLTRGLLRLGPDKQRAWLRPTIASNRWAG